MITAQNYAAQAERSLFEWYNKLSMAGQNQAAMACFYVASSIEDAIKFVVPDGGRILADGLIGIENAPIRLPFDEITVEYYREPPVGFQEVAIKKSLVLCNQSTDKIFFRCVWFFKRRWWLMPLAASIDCGLFIKGKTEDAIVPSDYPISDGIGIYVHPYRLFGEEQEDDFRNMSGVVSDIRVVLELLEALTCRNVSTANHQTASHINAKRIKDGKLPFYETKMLVINAATTSRDRTGNGSGTHASPRQHLRRGHIRRLPIGNIWVNSCIVGDAKKGIIEKRYAVHN